ncbi:unnamed protein product [Phytomonas sp. EM1]|nr:unnamed protein product [Phytomonas sp. EM1]|eukprot:CCW64467.1 unnamed protein product [Phytomonas sp. isolate EM1]
MDTCIIENDSQLNQVNKHNPDGLENVTNQKDDIETSNDNNSHLQDVQIDEKGAENNIEVHSEADNDAEPLLNIVQEKKTMYQHPHVHNEKLISQLEIPSEEKMKEEVHHESDEAVCKVNIPRIRVVKYKNNPRPVDHWEPTNYTPADETDDEFEISTCAFPVYKDDDESKAFYNMFKNGYPDYKGEVTSCFDEPHLLYRIINQDEKTWSFYNDTLKHEMHIHFTFGKRSNIQPLGKTTIRINENNEYECDVIVYPIETEMFIKGTVNGYTSSIRAIPLSDDYHRACQRVTDEHIAEEISKIREVCESDNAEEVLQACVVCKIPFVDPEFPPCQNSLNADAEKPLKPLAWARPSMFLPEEMVDQVRLFRTHVKPGVVNPGELGDSWVMCAVASVSEDPNRLMGMFRHPEGKEDAQQERSVGAYRVMFSKNGWWRSVLVDDYLPISAGRPKFSRSAVDDAEIWPCILQKAFAKLHGGYGAICSGDPLLAIQDMTGFPSTRFNDALFGSVSSAIKIFDDVKNALKHGSIVVFNTPGKDPKLDGDNDLTKEYRQLGLITGHAYTIIDARHFADINTYLVKVRNAWGFGLEWKGDWSDQSKKWEEYPLIANACNFKRSNDGTFWMDWESLLKYFNGGGVCLSQKPSYDYRINCAFYDRVPSTVLEIEVKSQTRFLFMILLEDKRGSKGAIEYQPVMISIAAPLKENMYEIILNSTADAYRPSPEKWSFTQARDVSLYTTLDAGKYIVVPRLMKTENQPDEVPFILGIITNKEVGTDDVKINFKFIDCENRVFSDFPTFQPDLQDSVVEVQYQKRLPSSGFPDTEMGFCIQ